MEAQNWTNTGMGGLIGGSYRYARLAADLAGRKQDAGVGTDDRLSPQSELAVSVGEAGEVDLQMEFLRQPSCWLLGKQRQGSWPASYLMYVPMTVLLLLLFSPKSCQPGINPQVRKFPFVLVSS